MTHLYVAEFSSGHIKVGRSVDPDLRLAQHAERIACVGISVVRSAKFQCVGSAHRAEALLIEWCGEHATARYKSEWFAGIDFKKVSEKACEFAGINLVKPTKGGAVQQIVSELGGPTAVATLCGGISSQAVSNWIIENHIPQARLIYLRAVRPEVFPDASEQQAAA